MLKPAWWADEPAGPPLDVGLARTVADFDGALRLLHDQYVSRGYIRPLPCGRRVGLHHVFPSTKVVVVKREARVIGTITLVEDSCLGLPTDEAFGAELGRLRDRGRRLAEGGSLAVDPTARSSSAAVIIRLLRMATIYAASIARADDFCFVVHPRHRAFYLRLFPFREFRERRAYPRLPGMPPVVGFRLDLRLIRALIRTERSGLSAGPLPRFLFGPTACGEVMARLRCDLPASSLSPPEWARLFVTASLDTPDHPAPSAIDVAAVIGAVQDTATAEDVDAPRI